MCVTTIKENKAINFRDYKREVREKLSEEKAEENYILYFQYIYIFF